MTVNELSNEQSHRVEEPERRENVLSLADSRPIPQSAFRNPKLNDRFAFVFFATQWRPDLTWPLEVCLHSLDTRGGAAASYPRYLVYVEEVTPEITEFCRKHRLILHREKRFTYRLSYPNKALMCRIPRHDAICLTDLDIVFLTDPTPMFEEVAATQRVHARVDLTIPLWPWPRLPENTGKWLRYGPALNLWRKQYRRFGGNREVPEVPLPGGGGTMPFYFNDGVAFIPGDHQHAFGEAWREVSTTWLRDVALRRPYTSFFTNHFTSQIAFALALQRAGIPWSVLPSAYNYIPSTDAAPEDMALLRGEQISMAHMVGPVRHWLDPKGEPQSPEVLAPLFRKVREVVRDMTGRLSPVSGASPASGVSG